MTPFAEMTARRLPSDIAAIVFADGTEDFEYRIAERLVVCRDITPDEAALYIERLFRNP